MCKFREKYEINLVIWHAVSRLNQWLFQTLLKLKISLPFYSAVKWLAYGMTSVCLIRNSSLLRSPNTDASKNYLKEISLALQKSLCGFGKRSSEAVTGDVLWEKVFLEISQNSQKNSSARVSFSINLQTWDHVNNKALEKRWALNQTFF